MGVSSEIGTFDDTVVLDRPSRLFLGKRFADLKNKTTHGEPFFGNITTIKFNKIFRECSTSLGLVLVLYQARHGGASGDRADKTRPLEEVRKRGRWSREQSASPLREAREAAGQAGSASNAAAQPPGLRHDEHRRDPVRAPPSAPAARRVRRVKPRAPKVCANALRRARFVEVFSGCGKLPKAIVNKGVAAEAWDICLGEDFNFLRPKDVKRLMKSMQRSGICGVHLGTLCATLSMARRPGSGPSLCKAQNTYGACPI